ncbi:hypothetical protein ACUBUE_03565 [Staphylococcus aureus]
MPTTFGGEPIKKHLCKNTSALNLIYCSLV